MKRSDMESLPDDFATPEEFWEFWDTHSSANNEDETQAVVIELAPASSTVCVPVAKDLVSKVRA